MKELLEQYKFYFIGKCNCLGPQTFKYKHGFYRVYWNRKQKKFSLKYKGNTLIHFKNEQDFETIWKKEIEDLPTG